MDTARTAGTSGAAAGAHANSSRAIGDARSARVAKTVHCPHCGCSVDEAAGAPRSVDQLRRYFKVIRVAFHHWPETAARQFSNEEELRAWAQMKAGYRDIAATIPLVGMQKDRALMLVEASIRAAGSYAMPVIHKGDIVIFKPRSISFAKLGHSEFCKLNDAVEAVLEQEIGIPVETLLRESEKAA